MALSVRSLIAGLFSGILLALLLQQILPLAQLPIPPLEKGSARSTHPSARTNGITEMLKNPLQIVRQAARGAARYKSARLAAPFNTASSTTPTPPFTSNNKAFSTSATMSASKSFLEAVKERRTYYALNKEAPIADKEIVSIVEQAVLHVPSSFNSQSSRLVVLLNEDHETFWEFTKDILKTMVPEDQFSQTENKINGFKGAYGSVSSLQLFITLYDARLRICLPH